MPSGRSELTYRPHLDGLRSVAVYLVLAYHAGIGLFRQGFIGVDVFFVLSGYLVTKILLRDLTTLRRVDLRRFYARRVRRILPAAIVVLVATAIGYAIVGTPLQVFQVLDGFRAAFLYVANWFFIHQSVDYFAANVDRSPVLQFWSLSVEEQFYLLWPLMLTALFLLTARVGRLRWWVLRGIVGAAALASMTAALRIAATNPDRAYYGTDTRAYQLLAGALLALTPQLFRLGGVFRRIAPSVAGLALGGLVLASTTTVDMGAIGRGVVAVALTSVLIVAVEIARGGRVKRGLSLRPVTYLGRVSYGTYLWHWPVVVIATNNRKLSHAALFVLTCTLATTLAALSYHLIEHPIRISPFLNRYRVPVVAAGLTFSVVGGLVLAPAILEVDGGLSARVRSGGASQQLDLLEALARAPLPDCLGESVQQCTIVSGRGLRVVLMGDSHARMWVPTFTAIAKRESWTLTVAALNECPWQRGVVYGQSNERIQANCRRHQEDWYSRVLPEVQPDIVILAHQTFDEWNFRPLMVLDGEVGRTDQPRFEAKLLGAASSAIRTLRALAPKVVIIEPIPRAPKVFDPLNCLSTDRQLNGCTYEVRVGRTRTEKLYRSLDDHKSVWSLNLDRLVCPRRQICDPVVHGIIVKRDGAHLTVKYAAYLAPAITADLRRLGVLAPLRGAG